MPEKEKKYSRPPFNRKQILPAGDGLYSRVQSILTDYDVDDARKGWCRSEGGVDPSYFITLASHPSASVRESSRTNLLLELADEGFSDAEATQLITTIRKQVRDEVLKRRGTSEGKSFSDHVER